MSEFTTTQDNLFAGDFPVATDAGVIVSGSGALVRGTVLGKVTASGKLAIVDATKSDGTETPYAVLAEGVDATSADKNAPIYLTGQFNPGALTVGSGTVASYATAMRKVSLFQKAVGERS